MNPRIQHLAEQANYAATAKEFPYDEDWFYVYNKTLAQLIVRECAQWIDQQPGHDGPCGQELLNHFDQQQEQKMNPQMQQLADQADLAARRDNASMLFENYQRLYTELLIRSVVRECIRIVETQKVSVGNSAAGELAAEWTMDALRQCREEIHELLRPG
jgi:hypothetical protein